MTDTPIYVEDKHGIQALTENILLQRPLGYAVVAGCKVQTADGALAPNAPEEDTLRIDGGSAIVDGTTHSISQQNLNLNEGGSDPRWDLVYAAPDGTIAVEEGEPEPAEPEEASASDTDAQIAMRPSPPDLTALTDYSSGTALAIAYIPAGATAIDNSFIFDRRVPARIYSPRIKYDNTFELWNDINNEPALDVDSNSAVHARNGPIIGEQGIKTYDTANASDSVELTTTGNVVQRSNRFMDVTQASTNTNPLRFLNKTGGQIVGLTTDSTGTDTQRFRVHGGVDVANWDIVNTNAWLQDGWLRLGFDDRQTYTDGSTPKDLTFNTGDHQDVLEHVDVTITNGTTNSVTEDITVELYEGVDTTGTLLRSHTKSVTVSANSTVTESFLTNDELLKDNQDYHVSVSQSGTTLSIDQTDVPVEGATYEHTIDSKGRLSLDDQDGSSYYQIEPDSFGDIRFYRQIEIDASGTGSALNIVGGGDIIGVDDIRFSGSGDPHRLHTPSGSTESVVVYDNANNVPLMVFNNGGPIDIGKHKIQGTNGFFGFRGNYFNLESQNGVNIVFRDNDNAVDLLELGTSGDIWVSDGTVTLWDDTNGHVPSETVDSGAGSGLNADTHQEPNLHIPMSEIPAGDYAAQPVYIPANSTLYVWMWGARTDGQSTPSSLTVELYDETGAASVLSESTARTTGSPVTSLSAGTTASDATLRLNNGATSAVNAGAQFGYTIE